MSSLWFIDVGGIKLNYVENGAGKAVILVHGIPLDYRAWDAQMKELSGTFRTISYSRRCSFPNELKDLENSTVENNAIDLAGLVSKTDAGPAHVVGHSYGAFVAAFFAFKHPELVKSLVLIEPFVPTLLVKNLNSSLDKLSLLLRMPSVALSAQKLLNSSTYAALKELEKGNRENAVKIFVNGLQQKENAFDKFSEETKKMMQDNKETLKELTTKLPSFSKKEAARIASPTLVISGTNTSLALSKMAEILSKTIAKSQLTKVNNSAHFPQLENPTDCNAKIKEFLSEYTG